MYTARIALVDDDPLFAQYLSTLLRSRGYAVDTYSSGADLLKQLAHTAPNIVLLDVLMPALNGLETLRAVRAAQPAVPVIMVSGQQVPATIVDAVRLGAIDYVIKPDGLSGLQEAALEAAIFRTIERVSLTNEIARLGAQTEAPDGTQPTWSSSRAMQDVMAMVDRVTDSDVPVLLTGESGVGKEVIARELHRRSGRRTKPFVKVNCAALPAELLESELFGHERGAFTGAQTMRVGKFEYAGGGTLLLDEIGDMPMSLQAKLLQVLQDGEVTRLGSNKPVAADVRVIAATNRDLATMITAAEFRADLYYRLQVIEIRIPPLRHRRDEIPALVEFFLRRYAERYGRKDLKASPRLSDALVGYDWPGNVRELENMIKRFVILRDEALLLAELERTPSRPLIADSPPAHLSPAAPAADAVSPPDTATPSATPGGLRDIAHAAALIAERAAIQQALDRFGWNRRKAAEFLEVSYKTLLSKMKECGIGVPAGLDKNDE